MLVHLQHQDHRIHHGFPWTRWEPSWFCIMFAQPTCKVQPDVVILHVSSAVLSRHPHLIRTNPTSAHDLCSQYEDFLLRGKRISMLAFFVMSSLLFAVFWNHFREFYYNESLKCIDIIEKKSSIFLTFCVLNRFYWNILQNHRIINSFFCPRLVKRICAKKKTNKKLENSPSS